MVPRSPGNLCQMHYNGGDWVRCNPKGDGMEPSNQKIDVAALVAIGMFVGSIVALLLLLAVAAAALWP